MVRPFRFSPEIRVELGALGHSAAIVAQLEAAAARYLAHAATTRRIAEHDIPLAKKDLNRIHSRAVALLEAIDEAHPLVRHAVRVQRQAVAELAGRHRSQKTKPTDHDRHDLEYAVGHILHGAGVKLTTTSTGKLGATLARVLGAVGAGVGDSSIKQIATRVCAEIQAEPERRGKGTLLKAARKR